MSLDLYLEDAPREIRCECGRVLGEIPAQEIYTANITHNLARMADEAGIYKHLWRPEQVGVSKAGELIAPIRDGMELMRAEPDRFREFDASNGWGTYEDFLPWLAQLLGACELNPDAYVRVSR